MISNPWIKVSIPEKEHDWLSFGHMTNQYYICVGIFYSNIKNNQD